MVSSIRTPMLIQGRLERTETKLIHFRWDHVNSPFVYCIDILTCFGYKGSTGETLGKTLSS